MAAHGYWAGVLRHRIGRRRALTAGGGLALGSAFLAACGGDDGGKQGKVAVSGLITLPVDTFKQAKRGGTLLSSRDGDVRNLDPQFLGGSGGTGVYMQILRLKDGYLGPATTDYVGETVESWEYSPDKLQITFKVRPNKTHDIPPVNGRPVDAEDIEASWKRFEAKGVVNATFSNNVNPEAPIVSVKAIDAGTVAMKLAFPLSTLFGLLYADGGSWLLAPKEADVSYDPQRKSIGWGPYYLADYKPSVSLTMKRHAGYHDAGRVFIDQLDEPIIPEYSTRLAQLRAGRIYTFELRQEDVLQTKADVPDLEMYVVDPTQNHSIVKYGWNPALATPFRDKRLRQALALAIDGDLLLDTLNNISQQQSQGIPLEGYRYTAVPAWVGGIFKHPYWLNPKDTKKFGPNAKYYQHDLAEAKRLVAAAGHPSGVDTVANWASGYGGDQYPRYAQSAEAFAADAGIRLKANVSPITGDFRPKYANPQGDFDGLTYRLRPAGGIGDPVEMAFAEFTPSEAVSYTGFFSEGSSWKKGDPKYTEILVKARQEFDANKRIDLLHEFQRLEAANQYQPSFPGIATGLSLSWPVLRNRQVYRGLQYFLGQWLDPTRKPLAQRS